MMKILLTLLVSLNSFASSSSLYDAKLGDWKDSNGQTVQLDKFKGKKVVMSMVYTSCKSACPLMIKKLTKIDKRLKEQKIAATFVVVTFDAKYDTPSKLKTFREHQGASDDHWNFLVGSEKDTGFLSNLLEINFKRNPIDQTINHDNKVILLNEKGEIIHTLEGLAYDPEDSLF